MNKKELSNLKRNFSADCGFFTYNHILRVFVDSDKNIVYKNHKLFTLLPPDEQELIEYTLRKGLSGSLGKNLVEYNFPASAYEEGGSQKILYQTLKSKLLDDEQNEIFLKNITENIEYVSTFVIFVAHCTYTLFKRNKNDELTEDNSDYNFLLTVLCPVETCDDSLIFDDGTNDICKRPKNDRIISDSPSDAFLFPILTGGGPDVNGVLCYSGNPKAPNRSLVTEVLGCEISLTAQGEKEVFGKVLSEIVGKDLDYSLITNVNERIEEEIKEHRFDEKPAEIDDIKLRDILIDAGVEDEKVEKVHEVFTDAVGKKPLTASNLVSSKTVVATPDITINIGKGAADKVRTALVGGRNCLVIDLDDPNLVINGLPTTIDLSPQGTKEQPVSEGKATSDDYDF